VSARTHVETLKLEDEDGTFYVNRAVGHTKGEGVKVTWPCGDSRVFCGDDLASVIADVEALAKLPGMRHPVWLTQTDSNGNRVYLKFGRDGQLHADTVMTRSSTAGVEWKALKAAIKKVAG
jgi:hypothetical protein